MAVFKASTLALAFFSLASYAAPTSPPPTTPTSTPASSPSLLKTFNICDLVITDPIEADPKTKTNSSICCKF